jgi:hypothetical protein
MVRFNAMKATAIFCCMFMMMATVRMTSFGFMMNIIDKATDEGEGDD